jgi:hypothetical protein
MRHGERDQPHRAPPAELIEEAKKHPGGWVYEIAGRYRPDDAIPPHRIRGAWKVDGEGRIIGTFVPNPNFDEHGDGGRSH